MMASKPGGRGGRKKFTSKGGNRHFSDFEELKRQNEEIKKEKAMQRDRENDEDDSDDEGKTASKTAEQTKPKVVNFDKLTSKKAKKKKAGGEGSGSSSSESGGDGSSSSDDAGDEGDDQRAKGVQGLIEIENPNRVQQKMKKLKDLDGAPSSSAGGEKAQMSRKEREALEAERKRQEYQRLHAEGKTDEARADLARLAIIRQQREEAAKKRDEEKKAKAEAEAKQAKDKLSGKH